MQYHPDRNRKPEARARFLEVLEAYEYLTGERKPPSKGHAKNGKSEEESFEEIMRDLARKRAKEKYRERVREFRRQQAEEQSREFTRAIYILVSIIVMIGSFYVGSRLYNYLLITADPVETTATVFAIEPRRLHFRFEHEGTVYRQDAYASKTGTEMKAATGMPLFVGDKFVVRYNAGEPQYYTLFYDRVGPNTLQRYLNLVSFKLIDLYHTKWAALPYETKKHIAYCMAREIYQEYNIEGLSHVYYAETFFLENISHNSFSWFFFKNRPAFRRLEVRCTKDFLSAEDFP